MLHTTNPDESVRTARLPRLRRLAAAGVAAAALALGPQAGMAYASTQLAAASTGGLSKWIQDNMISIGLLVVGMIIVFRAKGKDWNGAVVTGGIALFGIAVAALGTGTTALDLGKWLVGLVWTA